MAKHSKVRYTSSFSYFLEQPIEVPYLLWGYPDWLERCVPRHLHKIFRPVRINREAEDLVPCLTALWRDPVMGLDLENGGTKENDGLDPISSTSRTLLGQFGNRKMVHVVQPELIPFFKQPLESTRLLKINQNIEYDFKWFLKKYGIHIVRMYCTMLSEQVLRAGRAGFGVSLTDLVRHHACKLISKAVRAEFFNHSGVFTEDQLYYAARDVLILFDIFDSQNDEIKELGLSVVAQDEFNCIPATAEMELTGVNLDVEILRLSMDYFSRRWVTLRQEIKNDVIAERRRRNLPSLNPELLLDTLFESNADGDDGLSLDLEDLDLDSPDKLRQILSDIGLDVENVQRGTLKLLEHPVTKKLVEYSAVQKFKSTYGQRLIDMIHPDDHRLHPEFKQLGMGDSDAKGSSDKTATIATGRFSSDFQQLPRPRDIYELIEDPLELKAVESLLGSQLSKARNKMASELAAEALSKAA